MPTLFKIKFRPNWEPSLSPPDFDLSDRLLVDAVPTIRLGVERREDPTLLTHSEVSFSFEDTDGLFSSLFDLSKIIGTDPANYRAPLLHYGVVWVMTQEVPGGDWSVDFVGLVDPRSVKQSADPKVANFTAYSPGKLLEKGNAERVHRLASICAPRPVVLFGMDLLHPAVPPGDTVATAGWFKLVGGAAVQLYLDDQVRVITRVTPADYTEGMETVDLAGADLIVRQAFTSGSDLLFQATDEDGAAPEGLALAAGNASLEVVTPWHHNLRQPDLLALLVGEVNAAMAAAGYPDALTLIQESVPPSLGQSAVDFIDGAGLPIPCTGAAWVASAGARALLWGSALGGYAKPDILQDAVALERPFNLGSFSTAGIGFASPDNAQPMTYPTPQPQQPGVISDAAALPEAGQHLHQLTRIDEQQKGGKVSTHWWLAPSSLTLPAASAKAAYRLEVVDTIRITTYHNPDFDPFWRTRRGYTLGLYTKANSTHTPVSAEPPWALSSQAQSVLTGAVPIDGAQPFPTVDAESQPSIKVYPLGGGQYLYLLTDPGRGEAFWTTRGTDQEAPATLVTDFNLAGRNFAKSVGRRSSGFWDGTNFFYFRDRRVVATTNGSVTAANGSPTINGVFTRFLAEVLPGDQIVINGFTATVLSVTSDTVLTLTANWAPATQIDALYTVTPGTIGISLFYWDGAAMVAGTLVGLPALTGADFINAVFDADRSRFYIMQGSTLWRISYTFSAGTLTVTAAVSAPVSGVNYLLGDDTAFMQSGDGTKTRVGATAWLTGPVDAVQGTSPPLDYQDAQDAMLVVTQLAAFIYSDAFGAVVKVADFEGLSCSAAMAKLVQVPQQFILSGPDLDTVPDADVGGYVPVNTVRVLRRVRTGAPEIDLTAFAATAGSELWILQYSNVRVSNTKYALKEVRNDQVFTFDGVEYRVAAARFGGAGALELDNPFVFTSSLAKVIANGYAYELLLPRRSARVKVTDPFPAIGIPVLPLKVVRYLAAAPDHYGPGVVLTGRVLSVSQSLADGMLDLEIA